LSALSRQIVAETGLPYLACGLDRAIAGLAGVFAWSETLRRLPSDAPPWPALAAGRPRSEHAALAFLAQHGVPTAPVRLAIVNIVTDNHVGVIPTQPFILATLYGRKPLKPLPHKGISRKLVATSG
jgi:hypothetical protein